MNTLAASALSLSALMMSPVQAAGPRFVQSATSYAEKVKELEAVGGDPSFLEPPTSWDGSIDESAHFGGWEHTDERTETTTTTVSKRKQDRAAMKAPPNSNKHDIVHHQLSYMERKREIEAVGGDPSFLDTRRTASLWDGSIDEGAHFGGWES